MTTPTSASRSRRDTRRLYGGVAIGERFAGLTPAALRLLREAGQCLTQNRLDEAEQALIGVFAVAPDHPEALRLQATLHHLHGRRDEAIALLRRALKQQPDDALIIHHLGASLLQAGAMSEALPLLRRACELAPDLGAAWLNLGTALDMDGDFEMSHAAFQRAVQCDPRHVPARIAYGNGLRALGRIADAAAQYRHAIEINPDAVGAWVALSDLKTVALGVDETVALETLHGNPKLTERDRAMAGFALGKALEDQQRYAQALGVFNAANAVWRQESGWDRDAFTQFVDRVTDAFLVPRTCAAERTLGHEIIFIASLPRSGSTLTEQILAAHSKVEGGGERRELGITIEEESNRRRIAFPEWVAHATADDWERLGRRYLQLTARWRQHKPKSTDKALSNWLYLGAAQAMLPGAHFVNSRRDPLETAWSCFKQLFLLPQPFAYDFEDIGAYWRDYDRLMCFWHAHYPGRIYTHLHEDLVADPETQIRRMLDFCGLPFERACLRSHQSARGVGTASAAQVRQPLRSDTARAHHYGELLAPLRRSLGL
jgi:tetratricopeptide (TPR) repeat protein